MTTLITYEILTGLCQETGQQFHLVVFRDQEGAVLTVSYTHLTLPTTERV